ncbi:MAG TPA: cytochrome d ubiquinol oxidase subunit II [Bacteroidales bacterium]|nr:cytochrome d ubiquinol oxidase subunit II [Bacteroidales bacterium]
MTTIISQLFLQHYWWIIISVLASVLVFLMFVQGGQSVIYSLPQNSNQKTMIVNALGRKWETTFTTLVTFGGAFFASFPLFYSTSFGGAYWVWIAILFSFTIQAIAYEYRSKPNNILGQKTFDLFLFLNGSLGPFLIGVAVATFFTGAMFSLNQMNQVHWATTWYGLEALLNIRNLSLGIAVLFLARVNGLLYIIFTIDDDALFKRSVKALIINSIPFLIFFIFFTISLLLSNGYAVDHVTGSISIEKFKYFHNLLQMPFVLLLFLLGVVSVLVGIGITVFKTSKRGIWYSGTGTVLTVFALFIIAGFNGTSFYPSLHDMQSSLTINNASSSHFTLKTMMFVSFVIPLVLVYIWYAWKAINKDKITEAEMNTGEHKY